ncbi:hypothetical protein SKAU_G00429420 [Synaphobranchus kaupii]|uniref:Uncharacterized protein n=1 Tax=Synaphobranchus kaupii TaxID=118154 RepID=A0A9Q1E4G3_SYNKA|nr:hypothetical protein SKAU_G00429420 [Synaphobranchus kaupii]
MDPQGPAALSLDVRPNSALGLERPGSNPAHYGGQECERERAGERVGGRADTTADRGTLLYLRPRGEIEPAVGQQPPTERGERR